MENSQTKVTTESTTEENEDELDENEREFLDNISWDTESDEEKYAMDELNVNTFRLPKKEDDKTKRKDVDLSGHRRAAPK